MNLDEKIKKIEALIEKTSFDGERQAAMRAKERLKKQIKSKPIEYRISSHSAWEKRLFVALCKKHKLHTYRYYRQKFTTTMVNVSKDVMDEILWPEYERYAKILRGMLDEIANDLINKIYHDEEEELIISGEITASV